jgi:hypothetical protein
MPDAPNKEPIPQGMLQRVLSSLGLRNSTPQPGAPAPEAPAQTAAGTDGHRSIQGSRGGSPITWFGAGSPMNPQAPDVVSGRAFDYPVGYNLGTQPRQYESVSFEQLRALADGYDLLRLIIETRKDQMAKLTWSILPKRRANQKIREQSDQVCEDLERFLMFPDKEHSWMEWLRILLEDVLVIDAPSIYVRRTRGGGVWGLEIVDGATIKRILSEDGRTPMPPDPAYQQVLKGVPAVDYTLEELLYVPRNRRAHKVYGFSPVEQIVMTVNIGIRRQISQLQHYTEGNVPESLIGVPEGWTPDQIRVFQTYWDDLLEGNSAARRHAKFVPGNMNIQFTRDPMLKDEYDEWLARIVAYAFSVPALPFVREVNRATAETALESALNEGLAPLMQWVKDLLDRIIVNVLGKPGYEFVWDDIKELDVVEKANLDGTYIRLGLKSIDDVRAELGMEPVGIGPMLMGVGPGGFVMLEDLKDPERRQAMSGLGAPMGGGAPGAPAGEPSQSVSNILGLASLGPTPGDLQGAPPSGDTASAVAAQAASLPSLPGQSVGKLTKRVNDVDDDSYP